MYDYIKGDIQNTLWHMLLLFSWKHSQFSDSILVTLKAEFQCTKLDYATNSEEEWQPNLKSSVSLSSFKLLYPAMF